MTTAAPQIYYDPYDFDIDADPYPVWKRLRRLEARIALEELLARFPEWEVDYDKAVQARMSTVRGWEKLPIIIP